MSSPGSAAAFRRAMWGAMAALLVAPPLPAQQQPAFPPPDPKTGWPQPRLTGPIRVDGPSDDTALQAVAPLPKTVQKPSFRGAPTESTVARIA
jgi:hypothetical protein